MTTTSSSTELVLRVGTVTEAELLELTESNETKLTIDFGDELGVRRTVVDLAMQYYPEVLLGRQVVALLHADHTISVLGATSDILGLTLVSPDRLLPAGTSVV